MKIKTLERILAYLYPDEFTAVQHEAKWYTGDSDMTNYYSYYVNGRQPTGWSKTCGSIEELIKVIVEDYEGGK